MVIFSAVGFLALSLMIFLVALPDLTAVGNTHFFISLVIFLAALPDSLGW